ncbi:ABC transporter permease [Candidatus Cryosericum hinesii]|uniref:ABC transporter permease n=2 Tax=Candidatus Cryosericum hinesii TaxID=2290915 RepID=A0A398DID4_9BACT|nr:ABC transporter permease [Candidatus Cryosericum hinesii]RIE14915.1 ABC transporter permease [Candidatus Cryosericum hinesii]RIE15358.1 ABC transporter permease [Candidatus Cryosericum hinesii]
MRGTRMDLRDSFRNATRAIFAAKMRSFLTMLGIIIGIAAVVMLMAVGNGTKQSILSRMQSSGSGNLYLTAGARSNVLMGGGGFGGGNRGGASAGAKITAEDLTYVEARVTYPIVVSPTNQTNITIKNGDTTMSGTGIFATPTYFEVENVTIANGRMISTSDIDNRTRNVVIGATVQTTLFPNESAVGQPIRINGASYKVVGVATAKGESMGSSVDTAIVLPFSVGEKSFGVVHNVIQRTTIKCVDPTQSLAVTTEITDILTRKHKKVDFSIQDVAAMTALVTSSMTILTTLLAAIGGLSLLVGGIGIMNIMLVSVTERTREIGIRKALGARERDILVQFLIESSLLSIAGGILGIAISVLGSDFIVSRFTTTSVTGSSILLAVGFSIAVGVFFGVYPARTAARMKPVDALRYE